MACCLIPLDRQLTVQHWRERFPDILLQRQFFILWIWTFMQLVAFSRFVLILMVAVRLLCMPWVVRLLFWWMHQMLSVNHQAALHNMCKAWIRPTLEYGNILYSGAALGHLQRLGNLQTRIEHTCCSTFPPLLRHCNAAIIGLVCRLLAREGQGNLHCFCPLFHRTDDTSHQSSCLHAWDPADH